ncbi:MAG TPA: rRNA maturation RNase YbeY [Terriglobia bacterium]|nr:rRNA maturation RNase YbeY [Terriglobia bacterium]
MILNQQSAQNVELAGVEAFAGRLRAVLGLGDREFNVCFVDDARIASLNASYRGKQCATDVLSFRWEPEQASSRGQAGEGQLRNSAATAKGLKRRNDAAPRAGSRRRRDGNGKGSSVQTPDEELAGFLGDVVISVETAGRNAQAEGHPAATELRWLILHGLLHLLGMDHETDRGEMAAVELDLRTRLGLDGDSRPRAKPRAGSGRARGRARQASRRN